jgi:hypothetical protein
MRPSFATCVAVLCATLLASAASAADKRFPDWPCMQLKVPELSMAAVWSGPAIETAAMVAQPTAQLRAFVEKLSARRTSMDEAKVEIAGFITGDPAEKQTKAKQLFAGLFDNLNRERGEVMNGLERFSRKQKRVAQSIRDDTLKLRELQDDPSSDAAKIQELGRKIEWDTRVFEDRQKSTSFLCEIPVTIEQRLFALGRLINDALN